MLQEITQQLTSAHPDVEVIWNIWPLSMFVWTIFRFPLNVLFALFYVPLAWTWYLWNMFWETVTAFIGFPVFNQILGYFIGPINLIALFTILIPFVNLVTIPLAAIATGFYVFVLWGESQALTIPWWMTVVGVPLVIGGSVGAIFAVLSATT